MSNGQSGEQFEVWGAWCAIKWGDGIAPKRVLTPEDYWLPAKFIRKGVGYYVSTSKEIARILAEDNLRTHGLNPLGELILIKEPKLQEHIKHQPKKAYTLYNALDPDAGAVALLSLLDLLYPYCGGTPLMRYPRPVHWVFVDGGFTEVPILNTPEEAVRAIRSNTARTKHETHALNNIIHPLLTSLGYGVECEEWVRKELPVTKPDMSKGYIDLALWGPCGAVMMIIEVKKQGTNLDHHTNQLAEYYESPEVRKRGVVVALLTNGIEYRFFTMTVKDGELRMNRTPYLSLNLDDPQFVDEIKRYSHENICDTLVGMRDSVPQEVIELARRALGDD